MLSLGKAMILDGLAERLLHHDELSRSVFLRGSASVAFATRAKARSDGQNPS